MLVKLTELQLMLFKMFDDSDHEEWRAKRDGLLKLMEFIINKGVNKL